MLLEAGQPKEAQAAFQATDPQGAGTVPRARTARRERPKRLATRPAAAALYKKLLEQTGGASGDRPALSHAKTQTASR